MATYHATVEWALAPGEDFRKGRYSRGHSLAFDAGLTVPGSASPHVVGKALAVEAAMDPEEALTAALSACHMLTFLHEARLAGLAIQRYVDRPEGVMSEIAKGKYALTRVTLRPEIAWDGAAPDAEALARLHHAAHEGCYIANSVKTEVVVEGVG